MIPIYKAGILIGVLGEDIAWETLAAQLEDIHLYKTGYVCLMDAKRHVIYHPEMPHRQLHGGFPDKCFQRDIGV